MIAADFYLLWPPEPTKATREELARAREELERRRQDEARRRRAAEDETARWPK